MSKILQTGGTSQIDIYTCRCIFDGLLQDLGSKYPLSHLKSNSTIINNKSFESGICKIQGGNANFNQ